MTVSRAMAVERRHHNITAAVFPVLSFLSFHNHLVLPCMSIELEYYF